MRTPPPLDRREFLQTLSRASALMAVPEAVWASGPRIDRPLVHMRAIPVSGERIPVVGMGSWLTFNVAGNGNAGVTVDAGDGKLAGLGIVAGGMSSAGWSATGDAFVAFEAASRSAPHAARVAIIAMQSSVRVMPVPRGRSADSVADAGERIANPATRIRSYGLKCFCKPAQQAW